MLSETPGSHSSDGVDCCVQSSGTPPYSLADGYQRYGGTFLSSVFEIVFHNRQKKNMLLKLIAKRVLGIGWPANSCREGITVCPFDHEEGGSSFHINIGTFYYFDMMLLPRSLKRNEVKVKLSLALK